MSSKNTAHFLLNLSNKIFFFSSGGFETIYIKSFLCFSIYSSNVHSGLQGVPAATVFEGISVLTMLPAPIIQLSPIFTFGNITHLHPIKQFFPMLISPYITAGIRF